MIGVAESDDVARTGVAAGEHDGGFVGFGAAVGEERLVEIAGRDGGDLLSQGHLGLSEKNGGDVLEFIQLRLTLASTFSLQWPTLTVRMPPKKSRYWLPSASQTN